MDWAEIKKAGLACYNIKHLKERKRYWVYLIRCRTHRGQMDALQKFFHGDPLRREVLQGMPCLLEQATRAFFFKGADWAEREKLITYHIFALQQLMEPEFLRQIYVRHGRVNLWTDAFQEKPLTLDLLFHPGQRKEGCLSLVLHWGELDFYQIMFWLGRIRKAENPASGWGLSRGLA